MDQMNLAAAGPALGSNASYIEKLYARWKESPGAGGRSLADILHAA